MKRALAGRLNGIDAPIGTIIGPKWTREPLAVIAVDEHGVDLGYATPAEMEAMAARDEVHSVFEHRYRAGQ